MLEIHSFTSPQSGNPVAYGLWRHETEPWNLILTSSTVQSPQYKRYKCANSVVVVHSKYNDSFLKDAWLWRTMYFMPWFVLQEAKFIRFWTNYQYFYWFTEVLKKDAKLLPLLIAKKVYSVNCWRERRYLLHDKSESGDVRWSRWCVQRQG